MMPTYHCPFCPAVFFSEEKLKAHIEKFSWKAEDHRRLWLEENKYEKFQED